MKKLVVILLVLLLSGCSSLNEDYYRDKVEADKIELDVGIKNFTTLELESNQRLVYVRYVEYYEEYQFEEIKIYAFCIYDKCEIITHGEYLEIKE